MKNKGFVSLCLVGAWRWLVHSVAQLRKDEHMDTNELTSVAHAGLVRSLQHFGNTLSKPHSIALYAMLDAFSKMGVRITGNLDFDANGRP